MPLGRLGRSSQRRGSAPTPLVFFDALQVRVGDESLTPNKAAHIALGVRANGTNGILGL